MRIKRISSLKESDLEFGNKAIGIAWLINNNFISVDGISISVEKDTYSSRNLQNELNEQFLFQEIATQFPLAVRSSSPIEDSVESSKAGQFLTITNIKSKKILYESIDKVIHHGFANFEQIDTFAFIIQRFVTGCYSGVLFSSDSVSGKKRQAILSVCTGEGSKLVSGKVSGNEYLIQKNTIRKISGDLIIPKQIISHFDDHLKKIRKTYKYPADIEWTIDKQNRLYFVQIRPITGITPHFNNIERVGERIEPGENKEKINLRYYSKKMNLSVSKGWKIHLSTSSTLEEIKHVLKNTIENPNILSIVLITPKHFKKKIYRKFCKVDTLAEDLFNLSKRLKNHYLFFDCIIKEILKPIFTGMIEKKDSAFTIEIAKGHFIPKGVTSITHYLLNEQLKVISKNEPIQNDYFELTEDGPLKKEFNKKVSVSDTDLAQIASTFDPLLNKLGCVLEFGILKNKELLALDYIDSTPSNPFNTIQTGVISPGIISGRLIYSSDIKASESAFETHKKNDFPTSSRNNEKIVIWALRPSLDLTTAIEQFGKRNIGFVFSELSSLSHFSIILRELKIPAIWLDLDVSRYHNKDVFIDARSEKISPKERLKLIYKKGNAEPISIDPTRS